ncbi:hypothetical protein MNBD_NITROSPINAE02-233 [hydrothermal vent metagenome]|uniref:tRNA 5-methylaminomethyl-2-thiouridine synthase subunit TusB n=1 Tax=hydrothermal vent metagenome TaxID=652676 RepID=A0A3B1C2U9_9ZZZZ
MKTKLVLLTKKIDKTPSAFLDAVISASSEVALLQGGVYISEREAKAAFGDGFDKNKWRALDVDVESRRIKSDFELITYSALVDAIERNDGVVTI